MSDVDSPLLSQLLAGTPVSSFFEEYWQRKPLHTKGTADKFLTLFDKPAFQQAIRHCDNLKISSRDIRGVSMERTCPPDKVDDAFRAGATVCISGIQQNARLNQFMAAFAREVHQAGELSVLLRNLAVLVFISQNVRFAQALRQAVVTSFE